MKFEKVLRISSAVCQIIAIVTMVTGFASPYWIQSQSFRETGFDRMGLWEACFKNYVFPGDYLGQRHNGCFWIFHITYRNVWRTLNPEWLLAIQVLLTLSLVILMVTTMFVLFYVLNCCPKRAQRYYVRATHILNGLCFVFTVISLLMFGVKADTDNTWLPNPETNFLSWSFGICVLSGFFTLFAALCFLVEDIRLGHSEPVDRRSTYQMKPPVVARRH